jgi:molybdate/tungstate transport system substrate-binding protein
MFMRSISIGHLLYPILAMIVAGAVIVTSCTSNSDKVTLRVINAGSLMVPFTALEEEFESIHPNIDVQIEGHGSIQVIRQVTELGAEADVVAVADHSLIPMMMYDLGIPDTQTTYADWCLSFATNRLGVAYTQRSKYAQELSEEDWFEVLSRPDVEVGISDPRFDSCGYRALMSCQLAELYYGNDSVFESVLGEFSPPVTVSEQNGGYTVSIPQVLKPERIALRGSSVALLATVESGDVDYAFMYESVSEQHGLEFLRLPDEIDLYTDGYLSLTTDLSVELSYQRFASVTPEFACQPIVYGLTIPNNAPHRELALQFVGFLLGPEGQEVLLRESQPALTPPEADNPEDVPDEIKPYLGVGDSGIGGPVTMPHDLDQVLTKDAS